MDDRSNTIAGWVLAGGIVALGLSIVSGMYFHGEAPEKEGFAVAAEASGDAGGVAAVPIATLLATADVDVTTATQMLLPLPFSLGVLILIGVSLVSLVRADGVFGLVAMLLFPALALLSRYYTNRVHEPAARVQQQLGVVSSIAHESFDGALVVKTLGLEEAEQDRFEAAAGDLRTEFLGVARMSATFQPLIDLLPNLGMVLLLLGGAWRIDSGGATPGELVQAVALFGWLAFPMRIVGFLFESIPRSVVSIRRVDALLDEPDDPAEGGDGDDQPDARSLPDGPLQVRVDHLSFAFDGTEVLHDITFDVEAGEVVAMVGSTGSGKSTIAGMLLRLDEPSSGGVLVGGIDVTELSPAELRGAVSLVFQESYLFADSIVDNIRMERDLTDDQVDSALERARAAARVLVEFVSDQPGERQMLVFTCHAHVAEIFAEANATVRSLSEPGRTWRRPEPVALPTPARVAKPKPEPTPAPPPQPVAVSQPAAPPVVFREVEPGGWPAEHFFFSPSGGYAAMHRGPSEGRRKSR